MKQCVNLNRILKLSLCLWVMALGQSAYAAVQTITVLDRTELHEAMSFHDGYLWVGKSRPEQRLEIFDRSSKLVTTVKFNHTLAYITPYNTHSVVVVGTGFEPNLTHYTIVENRQGRFVATDHTIQVGWANHWIGSANGREYFTDMGGNPDDPEGSENPTLPAQTFFSVGNGGMAKYLKVRLRMPFDGVKVGNAFYVAQGEGIGNPRTNLVRLDPSANKVQALFPKYRNGITKVISIPGTSYLAATESGAGQLLVVDTANNANVSTLTIGTTLRTLAALGKCVIVASDDARTLTAVQMKNPLKPEKVGELAVELDKTDFKMLNKVVADTEMGRIYLRSNLPCNPMMEACNQDWNRVILFNGAEAEKIASSCK